MQCHNTDVILSARFSNKLEPLCLASCGKMNSIHEQTWELLEVEEYAQEASGDPFSVTPCVDVHSHEMHVSDDKCQAGSAEWEKAARGQKVSRVNIKNYTAHAANIWNSIVFLCLLYISNYFDLGTAC